MNELMVAVLLSMLPAQPSKIHTPHTPPANPQLSLAPACVTFQAFKSGITYEHMRVILNGNPLPRCKT
jgi:hypothetical protein